MARLAIGFFILALFSYVFGAYGIAGLSIEIGKILLLVFLVLAALSFAGSALAGRNSKRLL